MNKEDRAAYFLVHLNTALRGEMVELERLERTLSQVLADVRALGDLHIPEAKRAEWNNGWTALQATLDSGRSATTERRRIIEAKSPHAGDLVSFSDAAFAKLFSPVREIGAAALPSEEHGHWSDMWKLTQSYLDSLRSHAITIDLQMALRDKYAMHNTRLAQDIVSRIPGNGSMADVENFGEEFRRATKEFQEEKEHSGGFQQVLNAMFMYQETPEEKVILKRRNEKEEREEKVQVP